MYPDTPRTQNSLERIVKLPEVNRKQLEQAFINIVKNAMEAIEQEGIITITLDIIKQQLVITDNGNQKRWAGYRVDPGARDFIESWV